jgi:flagellar biosynthesis protein FlhF
MMMKKFVGETYYEAYLKAQAELGEDLLVITTKPLKNTKWGGMYSQELIEITAAVPRTTSMQGGDPIPHRPVPSQELGSLPSPVSPNASSTGRPSSGNGSGAARPLMSGYGPMGRPLAPLPRQELRPVHGMRSMQEGDLEPHSQRLEDEHHAAKVDALLEALGNRPVPQTSAPRPGQKATVSIATPSSSPPKRGLATAAQLASESVTPVPHQALQALEAKIAQISSLLEKALQSSQTAIENPPPGLPDGLQYLRRLLLKMETPDEIISEILSSLGHEIPAHLQDVAESSRRYAMRWFERSLRFSREPVFVPEAGPKVFVLIGPTGVGKTTTIAKLAASFALNVVDRKSVALFTMDTFRIGAPAQLSQYAQIIEADMEILIEPEDIPAALERHRHKDLILVDTAGRSQRNSSDLEELKRFLVRLPHAEKFLVLSATTKYSDMVEAVGRFGEVGFDHLIFTKLDETSTVGPLLGVLVRTRSALAYVTNGQSVPDDFQPAGPDLFAPHLAAPGSPPPSS